MIGHLVYIFIHEEMRCAICFDKDISKSFTCRCGIVIHNKCLTTYMKTEKFNKCFCPACKYHYTLSELANILNKTSLNEYLKCEYDKCYQSFLHTQSPYISKYKHLSSLLQQCEYIDMMKKLVSQLKYILIRYKQFCEIENEISESQVEFNEPIQRLEKFDESCLLFRISSDNEETENEKHFMRFIIDQLDTDTIVLSSSLNLSLNSMYLVQEFYHKLKSKDLYIKSLPVAEEEIEIMKNDKNLITKYKQLVSVAKESKRTLIMACECGGRIFDDGFCDKCFRKYCTSCYRIHEGKCSINDIETIRKELQATRPCPNCASRIEREDGCDHMWCLNCHIGFDWDTGEVILQNFRNPHRDKWMEENGLTLATYLDYIQLHDKNLSIPKDEQQISKFLAANPSLYPNVRKLFAFVLTVNKYVEKRMKMIKNKIICKQLESSPINIRTIRNMYLMTMSERFIQNLTSLIRETIKTAMITLDPNETLERCIFDHIKIFSRRFKELISVIEVSFSLYTCINRSEVCYHFIKMFVDHCIRMYGEDNDTMYVFSKNDTFNSIEKHVRMDIDEIDNLLLL